MYASLLNFHLCSSMFIAINLYVSFTCIHAFYSHVLCIHLYEFVFIYFHPYLFLFMYTSLLYTYTFLFAHLQYSFDCIHVYFYPFISLFYIHTRLLFTPSLYSYICIYIHAYSFLFTYTFCLHTRRVHTSVQGGEDSEDPLSCRSFSTKEPINIGHFCGKCPIKIMDPMSLRHPVKDV